MPTLGVVRVAQLIAVVVTPHRFLSKRQFWSYCGLAVARKIAAITLAVWKAGESFDGGKVIGQAA